MVSNQSKKRINNPTKTRHFVLLVTTQRTMTEVKTHYKRLVNPHYIGAYSLDPGQELNVTIEKVIREAVAGPDGKKEECSVAYLKGQKPFILNATNSKTIAKVLKSPYIEDWAGKTITLYAAKIKAFGEELEALRVKPTLPSRPELTPTHAKWSGAVKALIAGNTTIEAIKSAYTLSEANETLLSKEVADGTK